MKKMMICLLILGLLAACAPAPEPTPTSTLAPTSTATLTPPQEPTITKTRIPTATQETCPLTFYFALDALYDALLPQIIEFIKVSDYNSAREKLIELSTTTTAMQLEIAPCLEKLYEYNALYLDQMILFTEEMILDPNGVKIYTYYEKAEDYLELLYAEMDAINAKY